MLSFGFFSHCRFLSTLSLRRATFSLALYSPLPANFYPRSPCGERLRAVFNAACASSISIHALLAESDHINAADFHSFRISIHALLAESDLVAQLTTRVHTAFLSTLSLRRATSLPNNTALSGFDFYPRSPCGERLTMDGRAHNISGISIHALLAESDY